MSENYRTEHERRVQKRIFAFLKEIMVESNNMINCATTEDGKGIRNIEMYDRAILLVEMQSDIIDYLVKFSGESDDTIMTQLEAYSDCEDLRCIAELMENK